MQAALLALGSVKDVHPERQLSRSMLWDGATSEEGADAEASLLDCSLLQEGSGIDGSIAKRPGRCVLELYRTSIAITPSGTAKMIDLKQ